MELYKCVVSKVNLANITVYIEMLFYEERGIAIIAVHLFAEITQHLKAEMESSLI